MQWENDIFLCLLLGSGGGGAEILRKSKEDGESILNVGVVVFSLGDV